MLSMTILANFFISMWLWLFVGGMYQLFVSFIFMVLLMKLIMRLNLVNLLFLTLGAHLFSFLMLTALYGAVHSIFGYNYVSLGEAYEKGYSILNACITLGLVSTVFQAFFFRMLRCYQHIRLHHMLSIVFLSNMAGAFITYWSSPPLF